MTANQYEILAKLICMTYWEDSRGLRYFGETKELCPPDTDWDHTWWGEGYPLHIILNGLINQPLKDNFAVKGLEKQGFLKELILNGEPHLELTAQGYDFVDGRSELPNWEFDDRYCTMFISGGPGPKCLDLKDVLEHATVWEKEKAWRKEEDECRSKLK